MRLLSLGLILISVLPLVGCGEGRRAIQGTVNYEGTPVEKGQITFEPTAAGQRMAIGQIANGTYTIEAEHGPVPGTYKVRIDGIRMVPSPTLRLPAYLSEGKEGEPVMVPENYIPEAFNKDSTLSIEIVEDQNEYPFDLRKP